MSYDASIIFPACAHCGQSRAAVEIGNMTSNVSGMWRRAMPVVPPGGGRYDGVGEPDPSRWGIAALSGLPCSVVAPVMRAGVEAMQTAGRDAYVDLEPPNGWGSYEGTLQYLRQCCGACEAHPDGVFAVNW